MAESEIPFDRSLAAKPGEIVQLTPLVRRITAANTGPFTFTGTCTYIVGREEVVVIDPGPKDASHCEKLLQTIGQASVRGILVTHTHRDHSPGAEALRVATGAPLFGPPPTVAASPSSILERQALDAAHDRTYCPDTVLRDGELFQAQEFALEVIATPGHARHHLCFALEAEAALFSGDHVMAWSTTIVAPPDGSMGDYMNSLEKVLGRGETVYWPGHGGPVRHPQRYVRALLHHRRQREHAILTRLCSGDHTVDAIVKAIYDGLAPGLRGAAALAVLAHLIDLADRGLVNCDGSDLSACYWIAGEPAPLSPTNKTRTALGEPRGG